MNVEAQEIVYLGDEGQVLLDEGQLLFYILG